MGFVVDGGAGEINKTNICRFKYEFLIQKVNKINQKRYKRILYYYFKNAIINGELMQA